MAFVYAARYGIPINSKCTSWRVYDNSDTTCPPLDRVFPIPLELVAYICHLPVRNFVRGTECWPEFEECLFGHTGETDWSASPGYWRFGYEEDSFSPILRHYYGEDEGIFSTYRLILPSSAASKNAMNIPRLADHYPLGIGFSSSSNRHGIPSSNMVTSSAWARLRDKASAA